MEYRGLGDEEYTVVQQILAMWDFSFRLFLRFASKQPCSLGTARVHNRRERESARGRDGGMEGRRDGERVKEGVSSCY